MPLAMWATSHQVKCNAMARWVCKMLIVHLGSLLIVYFVSIVSVRRLCGARHTCEVALLGQPYSIEDTCHHPQAVHLVRIRFID